jgi:phage replication-related protein YjqB (UPF0714/DUF867 family)
MNDLYPNFSTLAHCEKEEVDFKITLVSHSTPVAIIAPHAGAIEPGTSEIARGIAGNGELFNLYLFEGCKKNHNRDLHITSSHFDEPKALALAARMNRIVTIHGMVGETPLVLIGGLDETLKEIISTYLQNAGIPTEIAKRHMGAYTTKNIANKSTLHKGVQLELSGALRRSFFGDYHRRSSTQREPFFSFNEAIQSAIQSIL